jgi:hypothetical protein
MGPSDERNRKDAKATGAIATGGCLLCVFAVTHPAIPSRWTWVDRSASDSSRRLCGELPFPVVSAGHEVHRSFLGSGDRHRYAHLRMRKVVSRIRATGTPLPGCLRETAGCPFSAGHGVHCSESKRPALAGRPSGNPTEGALATPPPCPPRSPPASRPCRPGWRSTAWRGRRPAWLRRGWRRPLARTPSACRRGSSRHARRR